MNHILIVEDDLELNTLLCSILNHDYNITNVFSGTEVFYHDLSKFDCILLDYMLPGLNGKEVLLKIREVSDVPVIMLTSISEKNNIVELLSLGAHDYVTKPFDINILKARIAVQIRNNNQTPYKDSKFKNLVYNINNISYTINGTVLDLSKKEISLLNILLNNPLQTFTKESIYSQIWDDDYFFDDNSINVLISSLRKKLKAYDPMNNYIETVWGIGIRLDRKDS